MAIPTRKHRLRDCPFRPAQRRERETIARLAERCSMRTGLLRPSRELPAAHPFHVRTTARWDIAGRLEPESGSVVGIDVAAAWAALKTSFNLSGDPFKNPRTADQWEPYLAEKQAIVHRLTRELADAEAELNDRVYRLFNLTPDEIKLLKREVERLDRVSWATPSGLGFVDLTTHKPDGVVANLRESRNSVLAFQRSPLTRPTRVGSRKGFFRVVLRNSPGAASEEVVHPVAVTMIFRVRFGHVRRSFSEKNSDENAHVRSCKMEQYPRTPQQGRMRRGRPSSQTNRSPIL